MTLKMDFQSHPLLGTPSRCCVLAQHEPETTSQALAFSIGYEPQKAFPNGHLQRFCAKVRKCFLAWLKFKLVKKY